MAIIAGLDYSITSPGLAILDTKRPVSFENVGLFFVTDKTALAKSFGNIHGFEYPEWDCSVDRYLKLGSIMVNIMKRLGVTQVMIEDYALHSKGKVFNLAENMSIMKLLLWQNEIKYHVIPPTSLKKAATGKGNANKAAMIEAFYEKSGCPDTINNIIGIKSDKIDAKPIDDMVDAYWLARVFYESNLWRT